MQDNILTLDYQMINNHLDTLKQIPISNVSMIDDSYDANTKAFLTLIIETITIANENRNISIDLLKRKIERLINDSENVINKFFSSNNLLSYYEDVLKDALSKINDAIKEIDIDSLKNNIINTLKSLNEISNKKILEKFNSTFASFKEEFSRKLTSDIDEIVSNLKTNLSKTIDYNINTYFDKNKEFITTSINESIESVISKSITSYIPSLKKIFDDNFNKYLAPYFYKNAKQLEIYNKLKNKYDNIFAPFIFTKKIMKNATDQSIKTVSNIGINVLSPIKNKITQTKTNIITEIIKHPISNLKTRISKNVEAFKQASFKDTTRKYGLVGALIKTVQFALQKKKPEFIATSQFNFTPFVQQSIAINSIDDFINSIYLHANVIYNNLKIYFNQNVLELYNVRNKPKVFKESQIISDSKKEIDSGKFGFFGGLIGLFLRPLIKLGARLLGRVGAFVARWIGRGIRRLGIKTGSRAIRRFGTRLVRTGLPKPGAAAAGKQAIKASGSAAGKVITAAFAFAIDGAITIYEAQDEKTMAQLFQISEKEVGIQQKTAYSIAGTLAGGQGLLDTNWFSGTSIASGLLSAGMNVAKWSLLLSPIAPPIGTVIGAVIGLAVSIIGTERLAKGINYLINGIKNIGSKIWNGIKWFFSPKIIYAPMKLEKDEIIVRWDGRRSWEYASKLGEKLKIFAEKFSSIGQKIFISNTQINNRTINKYVNNYEFKLLPKDNINTKTTDLERTIIANRRRQENISLNAQNTLLSDTIQQYRDSLSNFKDKLASLESTLSMSNDIETDELLNITDEFTPALTDITNLLKVFNDIFDNTSNTQYVPIPINNNIEQTDATVAAEHWEETTKEETNS